MGWIVRYASRGLKHGKKPCCRPRNRVPVDRMSPSVYNISPQTRVGAWRSLASALPWGGRGRRFKSSRPDQFVFAMGQLYEAIDDSLRAFLEAQKLFFVASAPLAADGHINLSPKGLDSFRILGPRSVAYLDLTGSGVETLAHARENGRVTLMFCAFEGPPKIVRLYGRARAVEAGDPEFARLEPLFPEHSGKRAILVVELDRIADSCGYGVPLYRFEGERRTLLDWAEKKGPQALRDYQLGKNRLSLDGLPGLRRLE